MNKQLVGKVKQLVMKNHEHFRMGSWTSGFEDVVVELTTMQRGCDTTGCLAAWVCIAAGVKLYEGRWTDPQCTEHVEGAAEELLECHRIIFHERNWPRNLRLQYNEAEENGDTRTMAMAACEALDYFGGHDE